MTRETSTKPRSNSSRPQGKFGSMGKKTCPFSGPNGIAIDFKDIKTLSRFVTERGRIMPRRITYVKSKPQRALSVAIKRARYIALMPYVSK